MDEPKSIIDCTNLSVEFQQGGERIAALDGVALNVAGGEFVGITGPSGSGKTTLLNVIGGLLAPTGGAVCLEGADLYALSDGRRARLRNAMVGFIFQTYHLHPMLTVAQNVAVPFAFRARAKAEAGEAVSRVLDRLGLGGLSGAKAGELSAGQRQRVVVARALAGEPTLVLADEPTANLDEDNAAVVIDALWQANQDAGASVLIVSHQGESLARTTRRLRMAEGRIVE